MLARLAVVFAVVALAGPIPGADEREVRELLSAPLLEKDTTFRQVQEFCERRVPRMPQVSSAEEWTKLAAELRERTLREVVLRGEAAEWAKVPTKVEWLDAIDGGPDYRIRKLRYEAVPGLWIPALLYEPKQLAGQVPVMLTVNGHDGKGKAADYKQVRCINLAKRGMLVLNVEWVGMGQLRTDDFGHYRMNQLDLCGTSGIAVHYLAQKRALDILLQHEHADPARVGVSGLSGGGWQTIFISGLDDRVTLANPVAGYSSFRTRAHVLPDLGDSEQTPCDLATVVDYCHLTAMRAPHPLLLTNNDRDRCCFTSGNAQPLLLEAARPVYRLYDAGDKLWAHVNHVPGSHNYERDNREALYRLIGAHWYAGQEFSAVEIECASEVKTAEELMVPLPDGNAGFNTLAKRLVETMIASIPDAAADRAALAKVVHSRSFKVEDVATRPLSGGRGLVFDVGEWSIPAVEVGPADAPRTVVVLCDGGRSAAAAHIAGLTSAGVRVVAVDPFYFGEAAVSQKNFLYALLISAVGERPLGLQSDQVRVVCRHLHAENPAAPIEVHAIGRRTGLIALVAAALEPEAVAAVEIHGGLTSLRQVVDENVQVKDEPELFCFGLLKVFDIPRIETLIAPRPLRRVELPSEPQRAK